jgi:Na+/proline symporter
MLFFIIEFRLYVDDFSTLSSGLNSLAAVVLSDIIKFFYRKEMTDKQDLWYSKVLCMIKI